MIQSFISQDTNIVCSNMTIFIPRKLGLDPQKELIEFAGISICGKKRVPLLNISDKKLNGCFICKMPLKNWGGLAAFFAGIAIAATVFAIVIVAEIAIPVIGPIIAAFSLVMLIGTAIIASPLAVGFMVYSIYRVIHECDNVLMGQWINYHQTAKIEKMPALLNKSQLKCPVGGTLDIILDDKLAYIAAFIISFVNREEVWDQWKNKFISGVLTLFGNGDNIIALAISCSKEYYSTAKSDKGTSNKVHSILDDGKKALGDTLESSIPSLVSGDFNLQDFFFGFTISCITFALDQKSKYYQECLEITTQILQRSINKLDQKVGNNIGIIAMTQ